MGLRVSMGSSDCSLNVRQLSCISALWEAKCPFATRDVVIVHELGWSSEMDVYKS